MKKVIETGWPSVLGPLHLSRIGTMAWAMARGLARKFQKDNGLFLASGLAFSLLLYLIPLALIVISVLGYTILESQEAVDEIQSVIRQFSPRSEQTLSETVAAIGTDRGLLGIVGFVSFLLLSTMVFGSTRHVLNNIFQASPSRSRSLLRGAAHDLLMMVFCVALVFVMTSLASVTAVVGNLGVSATGSASVGRAKHHLHSSFVGLLVSLNSRHQNLDGFFGPSQAGDLKCFLTLLVI